MNALQERPLVQQGEPLTAPTPSDRTRAPAIPASTALDSFARVSFTGLSLSLTLAN